MQWAEMGNLDRRARSLTSQRDRWLDEEYGRWGEAERTLQPLPAPGKCTLTGSLGAPARPWGVGTPGKRALTDSLPPVQRRAAATGAREGGDVLEHAAVGVAGTGGSLPYRDEIEAAGQITPDGGWDVRIAMRFVEFGGEREKVEQFRWVLFPGKGTVASVGSGDSASPLERFVRAGASKEEPPTVERGAIASFPDYDVEIVGAEVLERSPEGDGNWRIQFTLKIVDVKNPDGHPIVDDRGKIVELKKDARIHTTLDVRPRGGH